MNAAWFNSRIASLLPGLGFTVPIVSVQKGSARKESEAWNHNYIAAHLRMDNAPILAMGSKRAPACCRELRRSWGNRPSKSLLGDWGYGSDYQVLEPLPGQQAVDGAREHPTDPAREHQRRMDRSAKTTAADGMALGQFMDRSFDNTGGFRRKRLPMKRENAEVRGRT